VGRSSACEIRLVWECLTTWELVCNVLRIQLRSHTTQYNRVSSCGLIRPSGTPKVRIVRMRRKENCSGWQLSRHHSIPTFCLSSAPNVRSQCPLLLLQLVRLDNRQRRAQQSRSSPGTRKSLDPSRRCNREWCTRWEKSAAVQRVALLSRRGPFESICVDVTPQALTDSPSPRYESVCPRAYVARKLLTGGGV